jgi:hypothetical protein
MFTYILCFFIIYIYLKLTVVNNDEYYNENEKIQKYLNNAGIKPEINCIKIKEKTTNLDDLLKLII